jgi:hypothetical protein
MALRVLDLDRVNEQSTDFDACCFVGAAYGGEEVWIARVAAVDGVGSGDGDAVG